MYIHVKKTEARETYAFFWSDGDGISTPDVGVSHGVDNIFGKNTGIARLDVLAVLLIVGAPHHIVGQDGNILKIRAI